MFDESPMVKTAEEHIDAFIAETLAGGPRRFAVFGVAEDRSDAGLIGWGLDFEDEAIFVTGGTGIVHATSAESVRRMLARRGEVRLAWLDGTTCTPERP